MEPELWSPETSYDLEIPVSRASQPLPDPKLDIASLE